MKDFYVKNTTDTSKVYFKLKPILFSESEFTYEGIEIVAVEGRWEIGKHHLTYHDLLDMYEEGYHTIDQDEYERAEAWVKMSISAEAEPEI